jgi:hypothetical protein
MRYYFETETPNLTEDFVGAAEELLVKARTIARRIQEQVRRASAEQESSSRGRGRSHLNGRRRGQDAWR